MTGRWLDVVASELGVEATVDEAALLRTAREVAHRVERKATPLTTFLIGVAIGRNQIDAELAEVCARVTTLAQQWEGAGDVDGRPG